MNTRISLYAVGQATGILLVVAFTLCVAFDLAFPELAMFQTWQSLLPGFVWISWKSFTLGLIEAYAYGWFFALIWVPLFNVFSARESGEGLAK